MTAKTFATLAIMGLAASTSTAALAQSVPNIETVAAENAFGAPFLGDAAQVVAPVLAGSATQTATRAIQTAAPVIATAAPVAAAHTAGSYGYPAQQNSQPQYHQQPVYAQPQSYPVQYTREQWIDECYERTGKSRRGERGGILGALFGGVVGGVAGNRIGGRGDRTAGTLIGAGAGALAGAVAGTAIDKGTDKGGYCERILDNHLAAYQQGTIGPAYNTAARTIPAQTYYQPQYVQAAPVAYAQPVMYVEQQVAVPQRAVVREYVTEEWVEETEYVREREIAPRPVKRVPIKRVPIKYTKGN